MNMITQFYELLTKNFCDSNGFYERKNYKRRYYYNNYDVNYSKESNFMGNCANWIKENSSSVVISSTPLAPLFL